MWRTSTIGAGARLSEITFEGRSELRHDRFSADGAADLFCWPNWLSYRAAGRMTKFTATEAAAAGRVRRTGGSGGCHTSKCAEMGVKFWSSWGKFVTDLQWGAGLNFVVLKLGAVFSATDRHAEGMCDVYLKGKCFMIAMKLTILLS
jgi:hypothetical protein